MKLALVITGLLILLVFHPSAQGAMTGSPSKEFKTVLENSEAPAPPKSKMQNSEIKVVRKISSPTDESELLSLAPDTPDETLQDIPEDEILDIEE